jgi:hypothetical protein
VKTISIDQKITATITGIRDRAGNETAIDGVPLWASDSDSVDLIPGDDGRSCQIVARDQVDEVVNVTVEIDARIGDGVQQLVGVVEPIVIAGGEARFIEVALGEPEAKDEAEPIEPVEPVEPV